MKITITPELQQARQRCLAAVEDEQKIEVALRRARIELVSAEAEIAQSQAGLETIEASAALGDESASTSSARKKFASAKANLDFVRAKVTGLENKLRIVHDAIGPALLELHGRLETWAAALQNEADAAYNGALDKFLAALDRRAAVAAGLGDGRTLLALRKFTAPDSRERSRFVHRSGRDDWRNPESLAVCNEVAELRREILGDIPVSEREPEVVKV